MTEEHKQKLRDSWARRKALKEAEAAADSLAVPYVKPAPSFATPEELVAVRDEPMFRGHLVEKSARFSSDGVNRNYITPAADLFTTWFNSPAGRGVADPRMSRDGVRFGIELDDKIRAAFLAGVERGRA